ncbi:hypothetical protein AVEN_92615-1 [Araneus ventricosus]|uniref:Tc1-like transposase DDE domain-containing protein n=1 Tax=Araneus ventricosus TaxID=182803 RepID=A0A4Y2AIJ9_ARAVE|nr:hypothetical protein AVEN_92615-1 [Araneus ventricosus]
MQIRDICNPSAQRDAVGSAYVRQQVSDKAVGSAPAATMAGCKDLTGQCDTRHVKSLQEHSSDFRYFHCPPKSSDMNIIEPIWVALKCAVQKRSLLPGTPMDLRTALQDSWCEKPPGYLQTLVDTMPRRVASLLCACVGPKRY